MGYSLYLSYVLTLRYIKRCLYLTTEALFLLVSTDLGSLRRQHLFINYSVLNDIMHADKPIRLHR